MILWGSAELFIDVDAAYVRCERAVEAYLNQAFATSSLATLDVEIRYIPIIMPAGMRERYPARSKLRKKQNLYVCAPQLNYDVFIADDYEAQLKEYIAGLASTTQHLPALGASPEQVTDFNLIIDAAVSRILNPLH